MGLLAHARAIQHQRPRRAAHFAHFQEKRAAASARFRRAQLVAWIRPFSCPYSSRIHVVLTPRLEFEAVARQIASARVRRVQGITGPVPGGELAVWTGKYFMVFARGVGARYELATRKWTQLSSTNIPYAEDGSAVWTGS